MLVYIVQDNDTLCKISKIFNVSIPEIAEYNGITNVDSIKKGDCLHIPLKGRIIYD